MGNLVFVIIIAALAFWLGRKTKQIPPPYPEHGAISAAHTDNSLSNGPQDRIPMNAQRAFFLIFTTGWIIAWSAGIVAAGMIFLASLGAGAVSIFLGGWLIAAIAGWFFAAHTIYRLATGRIVRGRGGRIY